MYTTQAEAHQPSSGVTVKTRAVSREMHAGKSTFLKLLAGRLKRESGVAASGEVLYNGRRADTFVLERNAAYIDQTDQHLPAQKVHDLLRFAWQCQSGGGGSKRSQTHQSWLPNAMSTGASGKQNVSTPLQLLVRGQPCSKAVGSAPGACHR